MIWIKQQKIILFELSPLKLKVNTKDYSQVCEILQGKCNGQVTTSTL